MNAIKRGRFVTLLHFPGVFKVVEVQNESVVVRRVTARFRLGVVRLVPRAQVVPISWQQANQLLVENPIGAYRSDRKL